MGWALPEASTIFFDDLAALSAFATPRATNDKDDKWLLSRLPQLIP